MKKFISAYVFAVMLISVVLSFSPAVFAADDYPYKNQSYGTYRNPQDIDPWNFYYRECTSFVAWRLNNSNGVAFTNWYGGVRWGDAGNWGNAASSIGITVDSNPAVGAVVWWSSGHVAWVSAVDGSNVTIEEYNWGSNGNYNTRTIAKSNASGYIHIKDISFNNVTGAYLGDNFYAYIITDMNWIHLTANNNNVEASMQNNDKDPKQIWHFIKKNSNNQYEIVNEYDGKVLDIGSTEVCSNVQTFERNNSAGQLWVVDYIAEGIVSVHPILNPNVALDVSYGINKGNNIWLYTNNGTAAQAFHIYELTRNSYEYAVPNPPKPIITSAYSSGNVLYAEWAESTLVNIFDTRQYEVRIVDSGNNIIEWINVGNVTNHSCFLPKEGYYNVYVTAISSSYNTTGRYNDGVCTSSEPRQVYVDITPCAVVTNGNTYILYDTVKDYAGAKTFCESAGGHLATIASKTEQDIIFDLVQNGNNFYYWLGGTDAENEGTWKWITGEEWTYSNWNQGEPNDSEGSEDNIGFIRQDGCWNDFPSTVLNGFILEIDKIIPTIETNVTDKGSYSLVGISVTNADIGSQVVFAAYKNGRLVDVQKEIYNGQDILVATFSDYDEIKAMLWENMQDISPLCPSKTAPRILD